MSTKDLLSRIAELQSAIDSHGKLDGELLKKIQYRFRLDWNFNSNAMEGNSLTREETRSVMVNNITIDGKPLKDIMDMRGHDNVVTNILRTGKGELSFSEKRMKEMHAAIIYEDDPVQKKKVGQWKSENNFLTNYRGEKFNFVPWNDVPESMHKLVDWVNGECDKVKRGEVASLHPAILAFEFHLRYVTIHPFYDGNGRTARLFMNLILISFGLPPVIVKVEEKERYNQYLADIQAYGGSSDLFYEFMCGLLIRSQEIILSAIDGKDISQPDDFENELILIQKRLKESPNAVIKKSTDAVMDVFEKSLSPLLEALFTKMSKINPLFAESHISVTTNTKYVAVTHFQALNDEIKRSIQENEPYKITVAFRWNGFVGAGVNAFAKQYDLIIDFDSFNYKIYYTSTDTRDHKSVIKLYSEQVSAEEKKEIIDNASNKVLVDIKDSYKKITGKELL